MRQIKSERLKKLESELQDLEQWLKLGLVPKKDIPKHKEEIAALKEKVQEEVERLRFLKESGELEEYVAPKRTTGRSGFSEMPSLPDMEMAETGGVTEVGYEMPTDVVEEEPLVTEEEVTEEEAPEEGAAETEAEKGTEATTSPEEVEEEESFFDERKRWERGGIVDPDADEW